MSIARKCDRCDKLFEPDVRSSGCYNLYSTLEVYYRTNTHCVEKISSMDLCPDCHDELIIWLHEKHSNIGKHFLCEDCVHVGDEESSACEYCGDNGISNYEKQED